MYDVYDVSVGGGGGDGPSDNDIYDVMSDLMVTYSDFPNVLADDAVMVSTNFPSMVIASDHDENIKSNSFQVGNATYDAAVEEEAPELLPRTENTSANTESEIEVTKADVTTGENTADASIQQGAQSPIGGPTN